MADRPLVALTIAFAAGIGLAAFALSLALTLLACFLILAILFVITRRPFWGIWTVLLAFALLGCARYYAAVPLASDDVSRFAPAEVTLTGIVQSDAEVPQATPASQRRSVLLFLMARQITWGIVETEDAQTQVPVSGNVAVRLPLLPQNRATSVAPKEAPRYGDKVGVRGWLERPGGPRNPGAFDYRGYLARSGVYTTLTARRPEDWQIVGGQGETDNPWLRLAFALRQRVLRHFEAALPPERAAVLNGILLGERGDLPGVLNEDFERTGTVHVLATAGLHVGMVIVLLLGLLRLFRIARRPAYVGALLLLALYAAMAGGRPSVVRAVIVASVYLIGVLLEREPNLPNALALAALILLLFNPHNLFDAGFQLSFATVITIVLLMPFAEGTLRRIRQRFRSDRPGMRGIRAGAELLVACFFLSIAAQIGAAPLVAYYYNIVSLVSILANLLIVPIIALVIALGFTAAALAQMTSWLAWPLDRLLNMLTAYIICAVKWCAALPWTSVNVASPSPLLIVAYYAALWGLAWRWRPHRSSLLSPSHNIT
jgi:competence protein ComEC